MTLLSIFVSRRVIEYKSLTSCRVNPSEIELSTQQRILSNIFGFRKIKLYLKMMDV